eukprot:TRINITY_DN82865_c0_g1_i1.p1 TRINITY_DN82865_c0_g1~~TRINITY_DN82865_c0_g1_i1.p1  ORF type:complete len:228 (+),score=38.63 TRINITY_DN82865_c0_g1_i1:50-685(+)
MDDEEIPNDGGRPPLPGFSRKANRLIMEQVYKDICEAELAYVQERTANPPLTEESLGKLQGFKIKRHPSYYDVRAATPSLAAASTASRGSRSMSHASLAGRSQRSLRSQRSQRSSASLRELPKDDASDLLRSERRPGSTAAAGMEILSPSTPDAASQANSFVLPKYGNCKYSMTHMYTAQRGPPQNPTTANLQKVIDTKRNTRDSFFRPDS